MKKYSWSRDKAKNKWPDKIYNVLSDKTCQPIDFRISDKLTFICPIHGEVKKGIPIIYKDLNAGSDPICPKCSIIAKKETIKQTNLKRYGNEYAILNPEVKEKANQTMMKLYGTIHALQNKDVMDKFKNTMNERYDVDYALQSEELNSRMRNTMVEKYGTEHALRNEKIKESMQKHNQEKYNVDYVTQTYDVYLKTQISKNQSFTTEENYNILKNKELFLNYINNLHETNSIVTLKLISDSLGFAISTIGQYINDYKIRDTINYLAGSSYGELEIMEFLNDFDIKYFERYKKLGSELDFYIEDHDLGIEFNGLYWHCDIHKNNKYHYNKTKEYEELGIRVIHIYEDEWNDNVKRRILKSLILSACNVSSDNYIMYARKLKVVELDHFPDSLTKLRDFYNQSHLQGYRDAAIHIALVDDESNIIECMSFGHPFFGNNKTPEYHYELIRHCTKLFHRVVGGKERIFKYFINNYPYDNSYNNYIVSYCDIDKFTGKSYIDLGFKFVKHSKQYWVVKDHFNTRVNRNPNKNNDQKLLPKIYGCGNNVYVYNL